MVMKNRSIPLLKVKCNQTIIVITSFRGIVSLGKEHTLLHFVSLHPCVYMGTGGILLGDNPVMD